MNGPIRIAGQLGMAASITISLSTLIAGLTLSATTESFVPTLPPSTTHGTCKPYFDSEQLTDSEIQASAEFFITNQKDGPQGDVTDQILRARPPTLRGFVRKFTIHFLEFIPQRWGVVYCCRW